MTAYESLASLKAGGQIAEVKADPEDLVFNVVKYLTFDQSLTHTGWALVDPCTRTVIACDVIDYQDRGRGWLKSFDLTFDKAAYLEGELDKVIKEHAKSVDLIILEMPAVFGRRLESSLIAAEKIFTVCRHNGLPEPTMVSRQHAAAVVTGDGKASKKVTGEAVDNLIKNRPEKSRWNEHIRDAVLLAVSHSLEPDISPFQEATR